MLADMQRIENYNSPKEIRQFLTSRGMAPNRRFGQNFLISQGMREKITELLELREGMDVWEIGPGLGAMTQHLLEYNPQLTLFEIDRLFVEYLRELYGGRSSLQIVEGDVLRTLHGVYGQRGVPDRIIGNLPYNIASAIIASMIEAGCLAERMVFTVQKEVGARISAVPGTREYSSFSVLCQFACDIIEAGDISPANFYPQPHVTSGVLVLVPHGKYDPALLPWVSRISRALFSSRRKTIRNTLLKAEWLDGVGRERMSELLEEHSIDRGLRGEVLSVQQIADLARSLGSYYSASHIDDRRSDSPPEGKQFKKK